MEISTEQFFGFAFLAYFFWTLSKGSNDQTKRNRNPEPPFPKPPAPTVFPPPAPAHHALSMLIENAQRKTASQIEDSEKRIVFALNNSVNSPMPKKGIKKDSKKN